MAGAAVARFNLDAQDSKDKDTPRRTPRGTRDRDNRNKVLSRASINKAVREAEESLLERLNLATGGMKLVHERTRVRRSSKAAELSSGKELARRLSQINAEQLNMSFVDVWRTGGHEGWAMDVRMASLDEDQDGVLDDDEIERYLEIGEKLVDATQGFASNNGIVGGLILAVVFPVAIEYDVGLYPAAGSPGLDVAAYYTKCVAAVCLYTSAVIAFTLVGASARLYTQISFWMPNLESKVWFAQEFADWLQQLETAKVLVLLLCISTVILNSFAKAMWQGFAAAGAALVMTFFWMRYEYASASRCNKQLAEQSMLVLPAARQQQMEDANSFKKKVRESMTEAESYQA